MAYPTRATLRTRARARADQDASDFPTDAQYDLFLDEAARETYGDMVTAGWTPLLVSATLVATGSPLSITSGTPNEPLGVHGVYALQGTTVLHGLKRLNEGDRAAFGSRTPNGPATHYDVGISPATGWMLTLFPAVVGGSYRVDYIPDFPGFAADGTVWYGPTRSDELVVLLAARKGVLKEGRVQDAAVLEKEYERLLAKVQTLASWTHLRHPAMIRDEGTALRDSFDYDAVVY